MTCGKLAVLVLFQAFDRTAFHRLSSRQALLKVTAVMLLVGCRDLGYRVRFLVGSVEITFSGPSQFLHHFAIKTVRASAYFRYLAAHSRIRTFIPDAPRDCSALLLRGNRRLSGKHCDIVSETIVKSLATFETIGQGFKRNSRASKHRPST